MIIKNQKSDNAVHVACMTSMHVPVGPESQKSEKAEVKGKWVGVAGQYIPRLTLDFALRYALAWSLY